MTTEPTQVEARRRQAAEHVAKLENELVQLLRRRDDASASISMLNEDISRLERSGDASAGLSARIAQREAAESREHISNAITLIKEKLVSARAELEAAEIARSGVQ